MNMSHKKFWLVIVGVFFFGMILSPKGAETQVASTADTKPEVKTVDVVREVKVENREAFNRLVALDDEITDVSLEVIEAQSTALEVAGAILSNLDSVTVQEMENATEMIKEQTARITNASAKMDGLAAKRKALIAD